MIFAYSTTSTWSPNDRIFANTVFIRSINRPGRLLNYWPLRSGETCRDLSRFLCEICRDSFVFLFVKIYSLGIEVTRAMSHVWPVNT